MPSAENDVCLLCGRTLPKRKLWQRVIGLAAPTCAAARLDEEECHQRFAARVGVDPRIIPSGRTDA